jgi:3-oxoacyl-(acyl-carrier-protein) synthase
MAMSAPAAESLVVTGLGVVSAAGLGPDALWSALMEGRSLLRDLQQPWAPAPHQLGAAVGDLPLVDWVPARRRRRLNHLSRMALCAARQALQQAGLEGESSVGAVLGTGLGALQQTVDFMGQLIHEGPARANPAAFPGSVMNVAAAQMSIELGLRGYNTTVNHKQVSAELALMVARDAIRLGRAESLICGGVDELLEAVHHGHRRLRELAAAAPRPYRLGRDGLALGEGAAVLALERPGRARSRGARVLARVAAVGCAGGTDGSLDGPRAAMLRALDRAGMDPAQVDLIVGCGGGHRLLDRLEARAIETVFGPEVPLTSPHGALGSWMAAGGLRLVAAVLALSRGAIFPTLTAGDLDPDVPSAALVTEPRQAPLRTVLVSGLSTGGTSVAVLLEQGEG